MPSSKVARDVALPRPTTPVAERSTAPERDGGQSSSLRRLFGKDSGKGAASDANAASSRFGMQRLLRTRSDNDLQARAHSRNAWRAETPPNLPASPDTPTHASRPHHDAAHHQRNSLLYTFPAPPHRAPEPARPREGSAASTIVAPPPRPDFAAVTSSPELPIAALFAPAQALPFPGPPQRRPTTSHTSVPSTASSAYATTASIDSRSTGLTSPSLCPGDSASLRHELASSSVSPRRRTVRELKALNTLRGWLQDDLLCALNLGLPSLDPNRPRRLRDVLLGALSEDLLDALASTFMLVPEAHEALRRKQQHLWRTRDDERVGEATLQCRRALLLATARLREAAVQSPAPDADAARRERRARGDSAAERVARAERDLTRFLADAIDLRDVLDQAGFRLAPELRQALRSQSRPLSAPDAAGLLAPLYLDVRQRVRLDEYVARYAQLEQILTASGTSASGSANASTTVAASATAGPPSSPTLGRPPSSSFSF